MDVQKEGDAGPRDQSYAMSMLMLFLLQGVLDKENGDIDGFHLTTKLDPQVVVYKCDYRDQSGEKKSKVTFVRLEVSEKDRREVKAQELLFEADRGSRLKRYWEWFRGLGSLLGDGGAHPIWGSGVGEREFVVFSTDTVRTSEEWEEHLVETDVEKRTVFDFEGRNRCYTIKLDGSRRKELLETLLGGLAVNVVEFEGEVQDFFNGTRFYFGQPDREELSRVIERRVTASFRVMGDRVEEALTLVERKIKRWWDEGSEFLTESNSFFQEATRVCVRFDVEEPVSLFAGRCKELKELDEAVSRGQGLGSCTVISQVTSVSDLGGIGKTELARKYISEHSRDYESVVWINAESKETMMGSFARLARDRLGIPMKHQDGEEKDASTVVSETYEVFSGTKSLFVFDNLGHSDDLRLFLPPRDPALKSGTPDVLVTSRQSHWENGVRVIELEELRSKEAFALVREELGICERDEEQDRRIRDLVNRLQRFPLAIQQAVSYIRDHRRSSTFAIQDYLRTYDATEVKFLATQRFSDIGNVNERTIFTTCKVAANRIKKKVGGKLALKLLDAVAYLGPENITQDMLANLCGGSWNKSAAAVQMLLSFSMVSFAQDRRVLGVHQLVQRVTRLNLRMKHKEKPTMKRVFQLLAENFPCGDNQENHLRRKQMAPHMEALLSHLDDWMRINPGKRNKIEHRYIIPLLDYLCHGYVVSRNPGRSLELSERALELKVKHFSDDDLRVADTLVDLGATYGQLGNPDKWKAALERALAIYEKHYGIDHFEIANILVDLSRAYGLLGNPHAAKQLLERALTIEKESYGPDHIEVARTLVSLGSLYNQFGRPWKAKQSFERALAIQERCYGCDHFEAANTLVSLSISYNQLNNPEKARGLLTQALQIRTKHYGSDHYEVAQILVSLANCCGRLGRPQEQMELLERALVIQENHFGKDHDQVSATLTNLGIAYGRLGEPGKAKAVLERALEIKERSGGPEDMAVARVLVNLGNSYGRLGELVKEQEMLERALEIQESTYPVDQHEVAVSLMNLGISYGRSGDLNKEKAYLERALDIQQRNYGRIHLKVARTLVNLGNCYGRLGNPGKKMELLERAADIEKRLRRY